MSARHRWATLLAWLVPATGSLCQGTSGPPVRDLGAPVSVSLIPFSAALTVRGLPHGRVLVNDGHARRVVLLDSTLANSTVVLDTGAAHAYGRQEGGLFRYLGDSSLFLDPGTTTALILGPSGEVVRTGDGVGRGTSLMSMVLRGTRSVVGFPNVDGLGRFVYRALPPSGRGAEMADVGADTASLARWDVLTHRIDTVATLHVPKSSTLVPSKKPGGAPVRWPLIDPIPLQDAWAVLSDGGIAVVRARDYHVDWINVDGSRHSSARLPLPWQKITDDEKRRIVDSATVVEADHELANYCVSMIEWVTTYHQTYPPNFTIPPALVIPNGRVRRGAVLPRGFALPANYQFIAGSWPTTAPAVAPPPPTQGDPFAILPVDQLADYWPPFAGDGVRADGDGHVWVRTFSRSVISDGVTYDVVDRTGIIDRVRLRKDQTIVGFGPGGLVYVLVGNAPVMHLAAIQWR